VGVPLTTIAQAQARLAAAVLLAALIAALIALALAVLIARRTTQPLLELRSMAARLAGGDLDVQARIPSDEEVAALAQDFNLMASRLRQLLAVVENERQRLATILATMADGILLLGRDNAVTQANHPPRSCSRSLTTQCRSRSRACRSGQRSCRPCRWFTGAKRRPKPLSSRKLLSRQISIRYAR
jgi:signal transduction histidine kinase